MWFLICLLAYTSASEIDWYRSFRWYYWIVNRGSHDLCVNLDNCECACSSWQMEGLVHVRVTLWTNFPHIVGCVSYGSHCSYLSSYRQSVECFNLIRRPVHYSSPDPYLSAMWEILTYKVLILVALFPETAYSDRVVIMVGRNILGER